MTRSLAFCMVSDGFIGFCPKGGNFEVQKMNVGVAGFMSGSVKSIKDRLGGSEYHAFHRGGANHIA